MSQIEFYYNGINTFIQCNENEKMKNILERFALKSQIDKNKIFFSYDGKILNKSSEELTFTQMTNSIDKERKTMNILVNNNYEIKQNETIIKSKEVICPKCGENCKINMNNYKITLFDCKNGHKVKNILLNDYENTQNIDLSKIICSKCNEKKSNIFNYEFYKCYSCNINLCPLCKSMHDKNHNIMNYSQVNYICGKHNEKFINYCNKCKTNICILCENEHLKHDKIFLGNFIPNEKELKNKMKELKEFIDKFNNYINEIIEILNEVKKNVYEYYKIKNEIINNYEIKNRNYELLFNLKEASNNDNIIDEINQIIYEDNITNRFNNILNLYYKMNKKNEIKLILNIEKDDINKDIYFLDKTNNHLKEFNSSNVDFYINDVKYIYQKNFRPEYVGIYSIKIKLKFNIKDCSYMFYNCKNLIYIDLSSFETKNVTNMEYMFSGCSNLTDIDLSSFNTKTVINMNCMFSDCNNLANIDLSNFDTINVKYMEKMFSCCDKLSDVDLSSLNIKNVINMNYLFNNCSNLKNIDLSYLDIKDETSVKNMFFGCSNLKKIKINLNSFEKIKNEINIKLKKKEFIDFIFI